MSPLKRRAAAVSAPLLLALSLTACGGGASGAPDDASQEDFCNAYAELVSAEDAAGVKDVAAQLEDVGTPEDLSDDQRAGFEVFVDAINDIDADADLEDVEEPDVSDEEEDNLEAFFTYVGENCADALSEGVGGDTP